MEAKQDNSVLMFCLEQGDWCFSRIIDKASIIDNVGFNYNYEYGLDVVVAPGRREALDSLLETYRKYTEDRVAYVAEALGCKKPEVVAYEFDAETMTLTVTLDRRFVPGDRGRVSQMAQTYYAVYYKKYDHGPRDIKDSSKINLMPRLIEDDRDRKVYRAQLDPLYFEGEELHSLLNRYPSYACHFPHLVPELAECACAL